VKAIHSSSGVPSRADSAPDDRALWQLLDRDFDGAPGLAAEYPLLVGPSNRDRRWVIREGECFAAHAAWVPVNLISGDRRLRAAGIGLVTTARDRRGRGLAASLVASCLRDASAEGRELAILFGTPSNLYRRHGFVPAGRERITRVEAAPSVDSAAAERVGPDHQCIGGKHGIRRGGPADAARLLPLLERHPLRVERSLAQFETLLAIPRTRLWILEDGKGPVAYCVEGKGRDLEGVVHEWAGEPDAVATLARAVAAGLAGPLWLLSPESVLVPLDGEAAIGPVCQVALLETARFGDDDPVQLFGDAHHAGRIPFYVWGLDSM
jgi:predicted N-acetyltransferase YhbS